MLVRAIYVGKPERAQFTWNEKEEREKEFNFIVIWIFTFIQGARMNRKEHISFFLS